MNGRALRAGSAAGAFGPTLSRYLGQDGAPSFLTYSVGGQPLAVTRVWTDGSRVCETQRVPAEDAFHVILQCRDLPPHELWHGNRMVRTDPYPRHSVSIIDLRNSSRTRIAAAHEALVFYVPRAGLNEIAREYNSPLIEGLSPGPGVARIDPVMARLGSYLLPALEDPAELDQMVADQFMLTVHAHVAQAYGGFRPLHAVMRGGLAAWQERRAKELMAASIGHPLSLADIARECSLSVSHFTRGFRQATGMPPHKWLVRRRMDAAQAMLLAGDLPIAEVAHACGFAEQSSFTRTFQRVVGTTPAVWRRTRKL